MRPAALSIAVLLGIAALGAEPRAASMTVSTVTIGAESTVLVGGKRHHRHDGFHRGKTFRGDRGFGRDWMLHGNKGFDRHWMLHGDKGFARHRHGFDRARAIHHGLPRQHYRFERVAPWPRPADTVLVQRVSRTQFVLVAPTVGRSVRHFYVAPWPAMANGRFVRRSYHW
jgi:hypothetical protein